MQKVAIFSRCGRIKAGILLNMWKLLYPIHIDEISENPNKQSNYKPISSVESKLNIKDNLRINVSAREGEG
jgi:hypothetical protein